MQKEGVNCDFQDLDSVALVRRSYYRFRLMVSAPGTVLHRVARAPSH